jgi:hypothetical protein
LSIGGARKVTIPYTPPGVTSSTTYDIFMVPDVGWRMNSRFID